MVRGIMKKSLLKNNFREISKNKRRFISMLVMAFLGVGFFAGLVATSPDMLDSLDKYADKSNFYDINIISTLGITNDDIQAIKNIDGVENAYGIQTKDSMVKIDDKESVCKVIEYNENVNTPTVIAGRQIENDNECLLDKAIVRTGEGSEQYIGKKIVLENDDKDSDDNDIFTKKEFEIVGIVDSPMYISSERGNTSIGNGTVNFYIYTKDNVINLDYYTEMYVTVSGAKEQVTNSDGYLELVNPVIDKIESIKQEREEARYNSLVDEANEKINDAQKELDDKKAEVQKELNNAEKKIKNAENQIVSSENSIKSGEAELAKKKQETEKTFKEAEEKLKQAEETLLQKEKELNKQKEQIDYLPKEVQEQIKKRISRNRNN